MNMLVMGDSVNKMGVGDMDDTLNMVVRNFAIIGAISFVLGTIGHTLFEVCAERQIAALKRAYVRGVLRQDVAYYDTKDPGSIATDIEQSTVRVRDAIGMKFAMIWQFGSQFIAGYVVALIRGWQLALVMTSVVPVLGLAIMFLTFQIRRAVKRADEAYAKAGSIAEEVSAPSLHLLSYLLTHFPYVTPRLHAHLSPKLQTSLLIFHSLALGYTVDAYYRCFWSRSTLR